MKTKSIPFGKSDTTVKTKIEKEWFNVNLTEDDVFRILTNRDKNTRNKAIDDFVEKCERKGKSVISKEYPLYAFDLKALKLIAKELKKNN